MKGTLTSLYFLSIGLCLISLFTACSHQYYAPNEASLLALKEKKAFKTSGGIISLSDRSYGGSMQIGYSPIRHIGIQSSAMYKESSLEDGTGQSGGYVINGAVGTYFLLRRKDAPDLHTKGILLDLYGGVGMGKVNNQYSLGNSTNLSFARAFVQGGFHLQDSLIGFDAALKIGSLNYTKGFVDGVPPESEVQSISSIEKNSLYLLSEMSLRAYYKLKKANLYFSLTYISNQDRIRMYGSFDPTLKIMRFTTVAGVVFDLNQFKKKEQSNPAILIE